METRRRQDVINFDLPRIIDYFPFFSCHDCSFFHFFRFRFEFLNSIEAHECVNVDDARAVRVCAVVLTSANAAATVASAS